MEKTIKVNLGCGPDYKDGWVNVDNDPNCRLDICEDIIDFRLNNNSVDKILLSHVVMYLRPVELKQLLVRWHGWLKKGGELIIETSDFKKLAKIILEDSCPMTLYNFGLINIFGKGNHPPHRWGWTQEMLSIELYKAGFAELDYRKGEKIPERDYKIIATK